MVILYCIFILSLQTKLENYFYLKIVKISFSFNIILTKNSNNKQVITNIYGQSESTIKSTKNVTDILYGIVVEDLLQVKKRKKNIEVLTNQVINIDRKNKYKITS